jgi:hypothetical protein
MSVKIRSNQTLPRGARCPGGWPENSSGATRYDTRRSVRLNGQKDPRAARTKAAGVTQTPAASRARRSGRISRPTVTF